VPVVQEDSEFVPNGTAGCGVLVGGHGPLEDGVLYVLGQFPPGLHERPAKREGQPILL